MLGKTRIRFLLATTHKGLGQGTKSGHIQPSQRSHLAVVNYRIHVKHPQKYYLGTSLVIEPSCCGDLGDLSGWENLFNSVDGVWQQLWIGHPWIFYKRAKGVVELSDYTDLNLENFTDIKAVHVLMEQELAEELKRVRREQDDFTDRIGLLLTEMKITNAQSVAKLMTGAN